MPRHVWALTPYPEESLCLYGVRVVGRVRAVTPPWAPPATEAGDRTLNRAMFNGIADDRVPAFLRVIGSKGLAEVARTSLHAIYDVAQHGDNIREGMQRAQDFRRRVVDALAHALWAERHAGPLAVLRARSSELGALTQATTLAVGHIWPWYGYFRADTDSYAGVQAWSALSDLVTVGMDLVFYRAAARYYPRPYREGVFWQWLKDYAPPEGWGAACEHRTPFSHADAILRREAPTAAMRRQLGQTRHDVLARDFAAVIATHLAVQERRHHRKAALRVQRALKRAEFAKLDALSA